MSAYPTDPKFATSNLKSATNSLVSRSQSGKRYSRRVPGQVWAFSAAYHNLTRDQMGPIFGFALEQDGAFGTFTVVPPDLATPKGTAAGTPVVLGAGQQGTSLNISGCDPNQSGFLMPMDIFTIAGDSKVYMVTQAAPSDASGNATLTFRPQLEKIPADAAALTVTNVAFTVAFASGVQEYNVGSPIIYSYKVDFVEAA